MGILSLITGAASATTPVGLGWQLFKKFWWLIPVLGILGFAGYEKYEATAAQGKIAIAESKQHDAETARDTAIADRDQAISDAKAASAAAAAAEAELAQRAADEAAHAKRVQQMESANAILLAQVRNLPHDACLDAPLPAGAQFVLRDALGAGSAGGSPGAGAGGGAGQSGGAVVPSVGGKHVP